MSGIRGIVKDGWHPKGKDGGRESWRGDFKGINQVVSFRFQVIIKRLKIYPTILQIRNPANVVSPRVGRMGGQGEG
jgi:hypothetical protein